MTPMEDVLLAALKGLLEVSEVMTCGKNFTTDEMVRYKRSVEWVKRINTLAENGTN
jgi:hypothetical protein